MHGVFFSITAPRKVGGNGGAANMPSSHGLSDDELQRMRRLGLPVDMLCMMLGWLASRGMGRAHGRDLDGVEFFAGCKSFTTQFVRYGFDFATYEKDDDVEGHQDLCSLTGFLYALSLAARTKRRGLHSWAPVCSSWVWVNRWTSKRSTSNPLGGDREYVRTANMMVGRTILIILFAACCDVDFILEQPSDSIMHLHPCFATMLAMSTQGLLKIYEAHLWMGMLGAETPKPTRLWGSVGWLPEMSNTLDTKRVFQQTCKRYLNREGETKVYGSALLKASQAYPPKYGRLAAQQMRKWIPGDEPIISNVGEFKSPEDLWQNAQLEDTVSFIMRRGA